MDNIKNLLFDKRNEVENVLDNLSNIVKEIIDKKNKEIFTSKKELETLKLSTSDKKAINFEYVKNAVKSTIDELRTCKINHKLIKKLIKKQVKCRKYKKYVEESKQNLGIDTQNFAAFKVVAAELEEKEKINEQNRNTIATLTREKEDLMGKINLFLREIEGIKVKVETLNRENSNLVELNKVQSSTIETLTSELKNKSEKVAELKNYFLEILDNYNDLIQEVEE